MSPPKAVALPAAICASPSTATGRSRHHQVRCSAAPPEKPDGRQQPWRRSANYEPSSWDYDALLSIKGGAFHDPVWTSRYDNLKGGIKDMLLNKAEPYSELRIIDLESPTTSRTKLVASSAPSPRRVPMIDVRDVASKALKFRLLRENGFPTTPELLNCHNYGNSYMMTVPKDVDGLISLYEASYLAFGEEEILDVTRTFSADALKELMPSMLPHLKKRVSHALELPLHWRAPRLETRWFIDHYTGDVRMCPLLVQFAKTDFNKVQAMHQQELAVLTRWWKDIALGDKLTFARDRLMECFHYANGIVWEPNRGACCEMLAKVSSLIVHLDDVYDVYGTMDELVLFTDAIGRWDASPNETLPEYMQALYSIIHNTCDEVADCALKEHGCSLHYLLRKAWHDISMSFLVEAKWHYGKYRPSLQEYLDNGWVSSSTPLLLLHAFPMLNSDVNMKTIAWIQSCQRLIQSSSLILRMCNDSATHSAELQRGDAPSSVAIHMSNNGCNEQDSRKAMQDLILEAWKTINEEAYDNCQFSRPFTKACVNLARIWHCVYHGGDGFGAPNSQKKKQIKELFLEPIDETNNH